MTAARKLAIVATPEADVERAQAAVQSAERALEQAKAAEAEAERAYDQDDALADAAARATVARKRAERVLSRRQDEQRAAQTALDDSRRAHDVAELDAALTFLGQLSFPEVQELVGLDQIASRLVDRIADRVVEAEDVYARAATLAQSLGRVPEFQRSAPRPSLPWVALLARIAIAQDRERTRRDLANGWLEAAAPPAWDSPDRAAYEAAARELNRKEQSNG